MASPETAASDIRQRISSLDVTCQTQLPIRDDGHDFMSSTIGRPFIGGKTFLLAKAITPSKPLIL